MDLPQLPKALESSGYIVTVDAIRCQTQITEMIVDQDADYVHSLKGNEGRLYEYVEQSLDNLENSDFTAYTNDCVRTVNKGQGCIVALF